MVKLSTARKSLHWGRLFFLLFQCAKPAPLMVCTDLRQVGFSPKKSGLFVSSRSLNPQVLHKHGGNIPRERIASD